MALVNIHPEKFFSVYPSVSYKKGETILRPDETVSYIYYVSSGFIRMYTLLPDGKEMTLNIFKSDTYFPMFLVLAGSSNSFYYQTMTQAECKRAPKADVLKFLHDNPDALADLTGRISRGFNGLLSNIPHLLFGPASVRVASILVILSKRFGQKSGSDILIQLPLTHQDIANLIGLTRETTSLEMEKLVKKRIISYERQQVTVHNSGFLEDETYIENDTENATASL